jgi:hypothetical protein
LNLLPAPFSFIPLSSHSLNSFNKWCFSIYMNVYTVFAPYSPSYTHSPPSPPPIATNFPFQAGPVPSSCSLTL